MSKTRKRYFFRLYGRILILLICILLLIFKPDSYNILIGFNFFKSFSPFHILWIIWLIDMILQIIPIKNKLPLGSQKLFKYRFKKSDIQVSIQKVKSYLISTTRSAYKVFILWSLLTITIGVLYLLDILTFRLVFLISVIFYVCDLICVLIWCPFRLILKNKCCTTCRIFNWDHLMMFSPLFFIGGFYSISLFIFASIVWLVWELSILIFPERFTDMTNVSLKCSECTDKLCTQYCKKIKH